MNRLPLMTVSRILLVDDDDMVLGAMERLLRLWGYSVRTAASGEKALELLQTETFDIIISDYNMPHMMGTELLERIRSQFPQMVKRFIFFTGQPEEVHHQYVVDKAFPNSIKPFIDRVLFAV